MELNLEKLTDEQKKELFRQMKQEEDEKRRKQDEERKEFKSLVHDSVNNNFQKAEELSKMITEVKKEIFEDFKNIIALKEELYNTKDNQKSHSFSTEEGKTITLGYRVTDAFDDTVHIGIEKIKNWVYTEVKGTNNDRIKKIISNMLKEDKNGNLNAKRVLELRQIASEISDGELIEAVEIIEKAYNPQKSCYFIEVTYKDKAGKKVGVPLSISSAPYGIGDYDEE